MTMENKEYLQKQLLELLKEKERRLKYNKMEYLFFQDHAIDSAGRDVSRHLYTAHLKFFEAGAKFRQRAFIAANRSGKTVAGAYEMALHLTGRYPRWWKGRRFDVPISAWAVGKTGSTTRDILQNELVGNIFDLGSGMIPKELIKEDGIIMSRGTPKAIQDIYIKHVSGGYSYLGFKSYDQKVESFYGTAKHVIWHDEECDDVDIYTECVMRTMKVAGDVKGMIYTTFTPLKGLSQVVREFLPEGVFPEDGVVLNKDGSPSNKFCINCTWDDAPHLSEEDKKEEEASLSDYDREARRNGRPVLGDGLVYPIPDTICVVDRFDIPDTWARGFGMDFGVGCTACVWGARDPNTGTIYLYDEYARGTDPNYQENNIKQAIPPELHAAAINSKGRGLIGACDPSGGGGGNQASGKSYMQLYHELGVTLVPADRSVEPGIAKVLGMLETGQLKIMSHLVKLLQEKNLYQRRKLPSGVVEVKKQNDHLMDAMRYFIMTGLQHLDLPDDSKHKKNGYDTLYNFDDNSSDITGY